MGSHTTGSRTTGSQTSHCQGEQLVSLHLCDPVQALKRSNLKQKPMRLNQRLLSKYSHGLPGLEHDECDEPNDLALSPKSPTPVSPLV
jgi:hypothetical protein